MFFGIAIIVIGAIFLLQNLGILSQDIWNLIWPCLIILLGFKIVYRHQQPPESKWKHVREGARKLRDEIKKGLSE